MKVRIREPRIGDAKDLMEYINRLVKEGADIFHDKIVTLEDEKKWLKAQLELIKKKQLVMLVLEVDGKVVGNCQVGIDTTYESTKHRAEMGIGIAKDYRKKGLGPRLMRETFKRVRKKFPFVEILYAPAFSHNKHAIHVYEKLGFKKVGEIPKAAKRKGRYIDGILMYKYL